MKRIRTRAFITLITVALYTFALARIAMFFENSDFSAEGSLAWTLAGLAALVVSLVIMVVSMIRAGLYYKKKNPKSGVFSFLITDTNESYDDERERLISATATRNAYSIWQTIMALFCLYSVFTGMSTIRVLDVVYTLGIACAASEITKLIVWERANRL